MDQLIFDKAEHLQLDVHSTTQLLKAFPHWVEVNDIISPYKWCERKLGALTYLGNDTWYRYRNTFMFVSVSHAIEFKLLWV